MERKAFKFMENWHNSNAKTALLVTGARQVGKTYIVREFGKETYDNFVEINFLEDPSAASIFSEARNTDEIFTRLSLLVPQSKKGQKTLIFFDEIQSCPEIMTSIKFLVDDGRYDYILSGSLLGTELENIRSIPVGYLNEIKMYPLDFEEFCWAEGVDKNLFINTMDLLNHCERVDGFINGHFKNLFYKYLVVGGMPSVVDEFIRSQNLLNVRTLQKSIVALYREDISKYCPLSERLYVKDAFDLIPSELNSQNKRYKLSDITKNAKFREFEEAFVWLTNAGVAHATYNVLEPVSPLLASKKRNLFKLFLADVGLLMSAYSNSVALKVMDGANSVNCGAMYENAAAQEFQAHGFNLYYYNNKARGELDFVLETNDGGIIPIEIKSGKDYKQHRALSNLLNVKNYKFERSFVFGSENIAEKDGIIYAPIYFISALMND